MDSLGSYTFGASVLALAAALAYLFLRKPAKKPHHPVHLDYQSIEIEPGVRTSHYAPDGKLVRYFYEDAKTLHECFTRGLKVSGNGKCFGSRSGPGGEYEWLSYQEVYDTSLEFGSGLLAKGLTPGDETFIGIYSSNSLQWEYTEKAANMFSMVTVPLYDTLGTEACNYILNQTEMATVVVDKVDKAQSILDSAGQLPSVKLIILVNAEVNNNLLEDAKKHNIDVCTFANIQELGKANLLEPVPPKPSNLATICYTSGTTGNPKGVMLTHENIVANTASVLMTSQLELECEDVHICYLPLAHMLERFAQVTIFMNGARIGFFGGDVRKLLNDIACLKPTMFLTVPRLLNRIYDKVLLGANASPFKSFLFRLALKQKSAMLARGVVTTESIWDKLVFGKIQALLGGRLRYVISGSAPLSAKVLDFTRCAFGCIVVEGYGQTECTAPVTLQLPYDTESGQVGPPVPCNIVKLIDVPEMDYYVKDQKGEVCVKGTNVMKGYYKDPEKTAETIDEGGWVHTGDIGFWLPNGTLKIIDRRKHIFKLAQGEYIAPEKIEGVYMRSPLVAQVFLDGNSLETFTVAVIVPDPEVLRGWAKQNKITGDCKALCRNLDVKDAILQDITKIGKEAGLKSFEQAKDIYLFDELFSLENGLLTPTFKSKRPTLRKFFNSQFQEMYARSKS